MLDRDVEVLHRLRMLAQERRQLRGDDGRLFLVREMPCAGDRYEPGLRSVALGPADRIVEHVGVGGAVQVQAVTIPVPLGPQSEQSFDLDRPLREARDAFEKSYFEFHLAKENGSMTRVAEKTGLERTHLYRKLKQLGVDLSRSKRSGNSGLMGLSYGLKVHLAIRESLVRLNAAHLRLRVNRRDVPLPRLVEVAFDDGYEELATDPRKLKGSDLIALRVPEGMAELFGPACWTAVPAVAFTENAGLVRWLTGFFSTHSGPYPLEINDLYDLSGSDCGLREFRRRLKNALAKLEEPGTPDEVRVAASVFNKKADTIEVFLERWNQA